MSNCSKSINHINYVSNYIKSIYDHLFIFVLFICLILLLVFVRSIENSDHLNLIYHIFKFIMFAFFF